MKHNCTQFISQWLAAWTGNRPDFLLSFYDPAAYYRDPVTPQGLRGHQEIQPYFSKLLAKNPEWIWTAQEVIPTDKGFVLKWLAKIPTLVGVHIEEGLDIVELNSSGQITRNEVYFDRTGLLSHK